MSPATASGAGGGTAAGADAGGTDAAGAAGADEDFLIGTGMASPDDAEPQFWRPCLRSHTSTVERPWMP
ncbi:hypothetical protein D3C87_2021700 [compost metagenome]